MPPRNPEAPTWHGVRTGWLYNYHVTTLLPGGGAATGGGRGAAGAGADAGAEPDDVVKQSGESALQLFFMDLDGETFECPLKYQPYFFVIAADGHEREVELGCTGAFADQLESVAVVEKEDLGMVNHLSGRLRKFIKLTFANTNDLTSVRSLIEKAMQRNRQQELTSAGGGAAGADLDFRGSIATLNLDTAVPGATTRLADEDGTRRAAGAPGGADDQSKLAWMRYIEDIREYDVKYFVRVAIDLEVFVGLWYDITNTHGVISVEKCDDSKYAPAVPRICAFDIETTKAPLKFPQPETDQIYMISYMLDGKGFLIVNREIVSEDIEPFEYTPRPEYEGHFAVFNEADEKATLRRFYDEMKTYKPLVYVTYNGDYFDFPFIQARSEFHGMSLSYELGYRMSQEGATLNPRLPHLDCFYWVKRDSYLPQGSQGLKAVTKAKLGFEPIEVDPEDMLPLARDRPQMMASYSVSDAVSTYYLYMKYVHPFIYSLCTIIPMAPDDVLRKGSGTLCESLLCVQAYKKNVIWPNKQVTINERFHDGHLLDSETYIGGRVEALQSGVYRSDIPMRFKCVPDAFQQLANQLDEQLKFTIEVENGCKMEEITNYDEVRNAILEKLMNLRDNPERFETPLIYHLDVGAMYPNIILTNRLQPPAMVTQETCAGCCYNTPENAAKCKRNMHWKWRGEMFTANRHEYQRIKAQLETEVFAQAAVEKADAAATTKKTYGNKRGNVLEGTTFEKKADENWKNKKSGGGGSGAGYRKQNAQQEREAKEALLESDKSDSDGDAGDGTTRFHGLQENTQFALLKKRLGEYSRKVYKKVHESKEILKTATVCQRENSFYVDTVRLFRDRRYFYKAELKRWKGNLDKATEPMAIKEAKGRVVQMESLQLAHKCILNSFYGYVMRKGSRWYSMEMAGVVTYLGAGLIMIARQLVQQIGVTLELDTDGIWCCLPSSFPEDFTFKTSNPKKKSFGISYPCVVLNKDVQDRHTNHQYQDIIDNKPGEYSLRSECSIYFEVDGPYKSMILPASREQGKGIKKRYAVFHPDGRLAELKGFELKRRGELMLIKDFQAQVFRRFLDGTSLADAYASAAQPANDALDLLHTQGEGYEDDEILAKLHESSNMTRRLAEYPENQKSLALTTARRIADFLGAQMVKDKGLACAFVIARLPHGKPVTERPIPLNIFKAEPAVRAHYLRLWTGDMSITPDTSIREILDWNYYIARFNACVQKIISIPAALQHVANPVPRVEHPDWLNKVVAARSQKHKQVTLAEAMSRWTSKQPAAAAPSRVADVEDLGGSANDAAVARRRENLARRRLHQAAAAVGATTNPESVEAFLAQLSDGDDVDAADDDTGSDAIACDDADDDVVMADESAAERRELAEIARAQEIEAARLAALERQQVTEFRAKQMQSHSGPLTSAFFEQPGFKPWLRESKAKWLDRVRLRKQLFADDASAGIGRHRQQQPADSTSVLPANQTGAAAGLSSQFVDRKAKAMSGAWHVLEVRDTPDRSCPSGVDVLALVDGSATAMRVQVQRTILVELVAPDLVETVFGSVAPLVRPATGAKTLPRHHAAKYLYEVDVSALRDQGAALLDRLRHRDEHVLKVHEDFVMPSEHFIHRNGSVCAVNAPEHLSRVARDSAKRAQLANAPSNQGLHHSVDGPANYFPPREAFLSTELDHRATTAYLQPQQTAQRGQASGADAAAGGKNNLRQVFVFHAAAPESDSRAFVAAFFPATGDVVVAVSQAAGAARPNVNMKPYIADAAQLVGVAPESIVIGNVATTYVTEPRAAFGVIDQAIDDSLNGAAHTRVQIAVIQSALSTADLAKSSALPSLNQLAALRTIGAAEDNKILVTNPLTWVRDCARRAVQRFTASDLWLDERRVVAGVSHVPICNLKSDVYVSAWDAMYARALRRRGHVLWRGMADLALDDDDGDGSAAEAAMQTATPGGHVTWSVELGIGQVDIVATLFSQTVQEGDDPSMLALVDRGIGTHFAILRDLVSELYGRALHKDHGAGALLVNYSRWLRCCAASTHDPAVVAHVNGLVTRVLAALLIRVAKLGGRVVRADTRTVVIGSSKTSLRDCAQFAQYITSSLNDNAVLRHLAPAVVRFWSTKIVCDRETFIGLAVDAERVREVAMQKPMYLDEDVSTLLELRAAMPIVSDYTARLMRMFFEQLNQALHGIEEAKRHTDAALEADETVTLATRFDRYLDVLLAAVEKWMEGHLQPAIIRQVSDIVDGDLGTYEDNGEDAIGLRPVLAGATTLSEAGKRIAAMSKNTRVAIRYCKDVCYVLSRLPRCDSVIRKSKNNCLRLCGIGPFAVEAGWEKPLRGATRFATTCNFCNEPCEYDLSRPPAAWRCGGCGALAASDAIEAALVRRCHQLHWADARDDRICPKCRQVSPTAIVHVCSCGAVLKQKSEPPVGHVRQLQAIAKMHGFDTLEDTAEFVLEAFNAKPHTA